MNIIDTNCFEKAVLRRLDLRQTYIAPPDLREELENALIYISRSQVGLDGVLEVNDALLNKKQLSVLYYRYYITYLDRYPINFRTQRNLADISILAIAKALIEKRGAQLSFLANQDNDVNLVVYTEDETLKKRLHKECSQVIVKDLAGLIRDEDRCIVTTTRPDAIHKQLHVKSSDEEPVQQSAQRFPDSEVDS